MKKITLLMASLLISSLGFTQVVLSEDFEAGLTLPTGWTNNDLIVPSNGEIWTFETGGFAALGGDSNTLVYSLGGADGNYAAFDSDAYGNNGFAENAALESPVFNASTLTNLTLSFNSLFASNFGGTAFVEVLNGDAPSPVWETVQTLTLANYNGGLISLDVSTPLAGVTNAQVRFRWTGSWSLAWYIDNVTVFQCTDSVPNAVVSATNPTNGAVGVEIAYGATTNTVGPFSWEAATSGDPADSFNISLGETPSGNDIGTISGFPNGNFINFDWEPNTTYYWTVGAENCAGVTNGPIWSFTTAACTDIAAPAATSAPVPANGAIDVSLSVNGNALSFNWTGGDPDDNFVLNLGTTNPPTQAFNNFDNGGTITGLETNTTYFWSVDAVNCFGLTPGTVWSFTTSETLSVDSNVIELFSVYPNPTRDILNINSSKEIDQIEIYNLLGQNVASFESGNIKNQSIDISELSTGLYLVKISAGNQSQTIRVTKR